MLHGLIKLLIVQFYLLLDVDFPVAIHVCRGRASPLLSDLDSLLPRRVIILFHLLDDLLLTVNKGLFEYVESSLLGQESSLQVFLLLPNLLLNDPLSHLFLGGDLSVKIKPQVIIIRCRLLVDLRQKPWLRLNHFLEPLEFEVRTKGNLSLNKVQLNAEIEVGYMVVILDGNTERGIK